MYIAEGSEDGCIGLVLYSYLINFMLMMWLDKLNQSQTLCLHGIYIAIAWRASDDWEEGRGEEDCHHHSVEEGEELLPCL